MMRIHRGRGDRGFGRARAPRAAPWLLLGVLAAACGGDDGGPVDPGGGPGTVRVLLLDDIREGADTTAAPLLRAQVVVHLSTDGETWVSLGGPEVVETELQTGDTVAVIEHDDVPSGVYEHLRIGFLNATVTLDAGTVFDGARLEAPLVLRLDSGEDGAIDKQVEEFPVGGSVSARLLLELNSAAWITPRSARDGEVGPAELQAALRVQVRTDDGTG